MLVNTETSLKTVRQMETVLKEEPVQGLSVRIFCAELSGEELAAADGENELFPEQLLQVVKEAAPQAPHLYESRNALLAPVLILTDGAIENAEEMLLLTETGNTRLTPAESQMAQLLLGQSGEHTFPLDSGQVTFRRYLDFTGNLDTCIAIRMAVKKDGHVYVQAGGGIVADSIPENEYMESYNKALAVMNAVKNAKEVLE